MKKITILAIVTLVSLSACTTPGVRSGFGFGGNSQAAGGKFRMALPFQM